MNVFVFQMLAERPQRRQMNGSASSSTSSRCKRIVVMGSSAAQGEAQDDG
jgi:hypothetical protein